MDNGLKLFDKIQFSELMDHLNKGVLFKSRWQLSMTEGESELKRIIEEYQPQKLEVKGVYKVFKSERKGFFAVTVGAKGHELALEIYKQDKYFDYFLFNGFLSELAEATAEWIDQFIRKELGIGISSRISPGYPLWPDITDQEKLLKMLDAQKIGITLTEAYQLVPEHSITGMVVEKKNLEKMELIG
jgi:cobalamin-dependent methionine synthase I